MDKPRGYFGIGIWRPKHSINCGTLWRSAFIFGASFIFTVGRRFNKQASDTLSSHRHVPMFNFDEVDDLVKHLPYACPLIGVELDARSVGLASFTHPERACYLLGAEDHGLNEEARTKCHSLVQIPGEFSLNVAAAGTVVLYDRIAKTR